MRDHLVPTDKKRNHQRHTKHELERRPKHRHQPHQMQTASDVLLVGDLELVDLGVLLRERPNQPRPRKVLLSHGRDVREHRLDPLKAPMNLVSEHLHNHRGHRQRNEGNKRKPRADAVHERKRRKREHDRISRVHDRRPKQLPHRRQIVGRACHDVAGAVRMEKARRLSFQVGEQIVAQVELNLARDPDNDLPRSVEKDC